MKKLAATMMLAAAAAVFASPAPAQAPGPTHAGKAQQAQMVRVRAVVAAPVAQGETRVYSDIGTGKDAGWLSEGPDSSVAWVFALGFLGLMAIRRTSSWS